MQSTNQSQDYLLQLADEIAATPPDGPQETVESATQSVEYVRVSEVRHRRIRAANGLLEVQDTYIEGKLAQSVFTLTSLADVLGLPMTTVEGRYARGRLRRWAIGVPNGYGRPARGFPMFRLRDVVAVLTTPGAQVKTEAQGDSLSAAARPIVQDLEPTYVAGRPYFTIAALAEHFGYSTTTVRSKLKRSGLMRRAVSLGASPLGGRPRIGFPKTALGDIQAAVRENAVFRGVADMITTQTYAARELQQSQMVGSIVPHEAPPKHSLRAYDPATREPAQPHTQTPLPDMDDLCAELEALAQPDAQPGAL